MTLVADQLEEDASAKGAFFYLLSLYLFRTKHTRTEPLLQ